MSRLHKKNIIPLIKKYYIGFILLFIAGYYKNGLYPILHGYSSFVEMLKLILIPVVSFMIGYGFDKKFKNNDMFNSKFYSLLFSMIIPIKTNLILYFLVLSIALYIYNKWITSQNRMVNWIAIGKLILVLLLILIKSYSYQNSIEASGIFQYSILDSLFGHNISGLYTSNTLVILFTLFILELDEFYKKEIPLYSYGMFGFTVVIYAFVKKDMQFLLTHLFSSNVLFVLTFVATISNYTPYSKSAKRFYSILLGCTILPFSLITNFYEGVYISIILASIVTNILIVCKNRPKECKKQKK